MLAAIASVPFVSLGATATTAGASPAPITLAYITDVTGQAAAENGTSPEAFEARLAMQNAEGGVNGHKLVPLVIDDQTIRPRSRTAVQDAISKGNGVARSSPGHLTKLGAKTDHLAYHYLRCLQSLLQLKAMTQW